MADLQKIVDDLSSLTVLEAAELAKLLEEKWGVSAAAAVAVARLRAAGAPLLRPKRRPNSRSCCGRRRQEDRGHQGSPRHHRPGPQGSQGPRRRRAEGRQGRRQQGRSREDQGPAREGRRQGRAQVSAGAPGERGPGLAKIGVPGLPGATSYTRKCGDFWAYPSNCHDCRPISGRQQKARLATGTAEFPRAVGRQVKFRAFSVREAKVVTGGCGSAPRVFCVL